ncbi:MAG: hypothetical protein ABIA04_12530 [Pseudomonadota bacterium]
MNHKEKDLKTISLLEELVQKKGYELRYDKITGFRFDGAFCRIETKKLIVVDKKLPEKTKIKVLIDILNSIGVEDVFIPPMLEEYFRGGDKW